MGIGKEQFYHRPFGETGGSGQSFNLDKPVDLVGNMRALIDQARVESRGEFNAPMWLRRQLGDLFRSKAASTDPLAVQFLDAMAEATDIPHKPGQTTFNLTPIKYPDSY